MKINHDLHARWLCEVIVMFLLLNQDTKSAAFCQADGDISAGHYPPEPALTGPSQDLVGTGNRSGLTREAVFKAILIAARGASRYRRVAPGSAMVLSANRKTCKF